MSRRSGPLAPPRRPVAGDAPTGGRGPSRDSGDAARDARDRSRAGARRARPGRWSLVVVATAAVCVLGGAATPASADLVGGGTDAAGDSTAGTPERDLREVAVAYDRRRGGLVGGFRLGATPGVLDDARLTLVAGRTTPTGCDGYPAIGLLTTTYRAASRWVLLADPAGVGTAGPAEKEGLATPSARMVATNAKLRDQRPDCVIATLGHLDDATVVYDQAGPFPLRPAPVLSVRLRGVPKQLSSGTTRRVRVTVANEGEAPTARVRLRVAGARGLRASPSATTVPALRAGARRTVTVRLSLSSRARPTTRLRVTAAAGGQTVAAEGDIRLRRPARGGSGGGSAAPTPPRTCTRWIPDFTGESGGSLGLVPC